MARVTGIGGIFVKSADPKALGAWYKDELGLDVQPWNGAQLFFEQGGRRGYAVWSPFASDTKYFEPSAQPFMVNLRVDDLDGVLARLRERGARVLERRETTEQGKFGYAVDPDGTLLELWEPSADDPSLKR